MPPGPTIRAAFRGALAASHGKSLSGPGHTAAAACQNTFTRACRTTPLELRQLSATTGAAARQALGFSTSTSQPAPAVAATIASDTALLNSTSASSPGAPAPVLPPSALSQLLLTPSGSPSSLSPLAVNATSVMTNHPSIYATVHIHGRPYLVTPGDSLRLPFKMPNVQPGDELLLDRVGIVGNRNVTAVSSVSHSESDSFDVAHIPGATVKAVVLGVETEPLRVMIKKKRRTRRKRSVRSKHHFTVLRIQELSLVE
ncbi:hypothetical protein SEPCBS119000_004397 [Sporothrix epigloea]|uniref:Large ribosomal subunit protein bL21m n=1 Tax=Sporothrix epigloea TaxID=1892477 RepID=A0ABP0DU20_9PEZI